MCTTFIARLVLGLVNMLVFLIGLVMVILGIIMQSSDDFYKDVFSGLKDKASSTAEDAGFAVDTSDFNAADIAYSFSIAIIIFGIFLAGMAILGIIGVKYGIKVVLIVYFIITLVLFLVQLALVLIAVIDRDMFDGTVKPRLKDTITKNFEGLESDDPVTQVWNGIMAELDCCGVDDYKDFDDADKWVTFRVNNALITPIACCKTVPSSPPFICATIPTDSNNNYMTGCYAKIWDYVVRDSGIVTSIVVLILFSQLVILLLTIILLNNSGKVAP